MSKIGGPVIIIYALIMLGGGIAGFATKHSMPSLISGIVSAVLFGVAFTMLPTRPKTGFGLSLVVALLLTALFILRTVQTAAEASSMHRNIGLAVLSGVVAIIFGACLKG